MKKGQIYEGIIERVDFPNKGIVFVPEEEQYVIVKNGIPGQKIRFMINKFKRGNAETFHSPRFQSILIINIIMISIRTIT